MLFITMIIIFILIFATILKITMITITTGRVCEGLLQPRPHRGTHLPSDLLPLCKLLAGVPIDLVPGELVVLG